MHLGNCICPYCIDERERIALGEVDTRTPPKEAAGGARIRLIHVAAKVARREYLPDLSTCRTIQNARDLVAQYDGYHCALANELSNLATALRPQPSEGLTEEETARLDKIMLRSKLPDRDDFTFLATLIRRLQSALASKEAELERLRQPQGKE